MFWERRVRREARPPVADDGWTGTCLSRGRVDRGHPRLLRPIQRGILRFTGWDVLKPNIVYAPVRVSDEQRQAGLDAWAARLRGIEKERPVEVGEY